MIDIPSCRWKEDLEVLCSHTCKLRRHLEPGLSERGTFSSPSQPSLLLWPLKIKRIKCSSSQTLILPRWRQISSIQTMRHIFPLETLGVYPRKKESARKCSLGACTFSRSWKLSRKWNHSAYTWQRGCKIAPKLNNMHLCLWFSSVSLYKWVRERAHKQFTSIRAAYTELPFGIEKKKAW